MTESTDEAVRGAGADEAPGAADANSAGTGEGSQQGAVAFPYAAAGAAFTHWFNDKVRQLPSPTIMLGTKRARVLELHEDGRLECEVETEALEPEKLFVVFDTSHLEQLIRRITALGL